MDKFAMDNSMGSFYDHLDRKDYKHAAETFMKMDEADKQLIVKRENAVLKCLQEGQSELAGMLIDHGGDINYTFYGLHNAPIFEAIKHGDLNNVKKMIDRGVNMETKSKDGHTTLAYAASNDQVAIAEYLIQHGAKSDNVYHNGLSGKEALLDIASKGNSRDEVLSHKEQYPMFQMINQAIEDKPSFKYVVEKGIESVAVKLNHLIHGDEFKFDPSKIGVLSNQQQNHELHDSQKPS